MPRPELIFVTRRPPWPLDNGARIRSARLAQGLSRTFATTLVTYADGPAYDETTASRRELEALLPGVEIELVRFGSTAVPGVRRNLPRRASASWGIYGAPALREALRRRLAAVPNALLHLDDPGVGVAGLGLAPGRTAFAPHNVEHRILKDIALTLPWHRRPFLAAEWRKVAVEERRCWRAADLCVAISELDAAPMRAAGARSVVLCPNGSDDHEPLPPRDRQADQPVRLVFVGSGAFWPYERGLAWFVREVVPRLRDGGGVRFDVVGEPPPRPVTAPEVTYHGRVPDVRPFYGAADALVVPVFEGSGTRLKIVEATLLGRPVISTALGAEGLGLRPGVHFRLAESPADFAHAVAELRSGQLAHLPAAARELLAPLTWPRIAEALAEAYRPLAGR